MFECLLRKIYLGGPAALGLWENIPLHDVCARLSGVASEHWLVAPEACEELIDRHVHAWALVVSAAATVYVAHHAVNLILHMMVNGSVLSAAASQRRSEVLYMPYLHSAGHVERCDLHTPHIVYTLDKSAVESDERSRS